MIKVIVNLKKCDYSVSGNGRIHDGWALFHDVLTQTYNRYHEAFYDMYLNELSEKFLVELEQAVSIFAFAANPDSNKKLCTIKMWGIDMEISSFNPSYNAYRIDKGMKLLKSSLETWDILKEKAAYRYESYRQYVT